MANLVDFVNNELSTKKDFPEFGAGDTITVYYEIKEGEKTRTQFGSRRGRPCRRPASPSAPS